MCYRNTIFISFSIPQQWWSRSSMYHQYPAAAKHLELTEPTGSLDTAFQLNHLQAVAG
jgi:hypothetical protein